MNTSNSKIPLTMESLDLPQELYWDPKIEPVSPPSMLDGELFTLDDPTFLYNDNFADGITLLSVEEADSLEKSACLELLNDEDFVVELMDMKDEECLLDHKASHYIDYETSGFPQPLDVVQQDMLPITKVQVANAANVSDFQHADSSMILQQLTPPQSPPQFEAQLQQQQQQQLQQQEESVKQESKQLQYATDAIPTTTAAVAATAAAATAGAAYGFNNWMPVNEITPEIQLVDDIVNMRAQELQLPINWQQYNDDCESQASSTLCSSSSSSSSSSSPSPSSSIADADEDWQPGSSCSSSISSPIGDEQLSTASGKAAKKRTRTYGRGVEDRKIRKKEQNKNAATRYRQKKKEEMKHVLDEEQHLQETNAELRRQLADRRNESRYLRQLIREFYKDKQ